MYSLSYTACHLCISASAKGDEGLADLLDLGQCAVPTDLHIMAGTIDITLYGAGQLNLPHLPARGGGECTAVNCHTQMVQIGTMIMK